jgi:Na+-translocating ferredoxin:NAD+ oxidoreductase RnfE subunit
MKKFMQDFWAVFDKDIQSEGFTLYEKMLFGIIVPGAFVAICVLVDMVKSSVIY